MKQNTHKSNNFGKKELAKSHDTEESETENKIKKIKILLSIEDNSEEEEYKLKEDENNIENSFKNEQNSSISSIEIGEVYKNLYPLIEEEIPEEIEFEDDTAKEKEKNNANINIDEVSISKNSKMFNSNMTENNTKPPIIEKRSKLGMPPIILGKKIQIKHHLIKL